MGDSVQGILTTGFEKFPGQGIVDAMKTGKALKDGPPPPPPIIIMPPAAQPAVAADPAGPNATVEAAKKKQKGAQGMSQDKLTGPQGLGEVPQQNQERKTLLGY